MTPISATPRSHRWARRLLFAGLIGLLAVLALILALPRILSSSWFRDLLTDEASQLAGRPVALERLHLTWSGELSVEGLTVADLPEFSPEPLLELRALHLRVDPGGVLRGRLATEIFLEGVRVRLLRGPDGRTNLETLAASLAPPSGAPKEPGPREGPYPLGFKDLSARVRLSGIEVEVEDHALGHRAALREGSLQLDVPSLLDPVEARVSARVDLDGREFPAIRLRARGERLLRPDGTPNLADASAEVEGSFPGVELRLRGDLGSSSLGGTLEADLASLLEVGGPFLPAEVGQTGLSGHLRLLLDGEGAPGGSMAVGVAVEGSGLAAAGPLLGERGFGPLDFRLEGRGTADPATGAYRAEEGTLELQENTRVAWSGSVAALGTPEAEATAVVGPAVLDLGELAGLAAPFLPDGLAVRLSGTSRLTLARGLLEGPLSSEGVTGPHHRASLEGLALRLERASASLEGSSLEAGGVELEVPLLSIELRDFLPENGHLRARGRVGHLRAGGPREASLQDLQVGPLVVELEGLEKIGKSPGFRGRGSLNAAAELGRVEIPGVLELKGVRHSAEVDLTLGGAGEVAAAVRNVLLTLEAGTAGPGGIRAVLDARGEGRAATLELEEARLEGALLGPHPLEGDLPVEVRGLHLDLASLSTGGSGGAAGEGLTVRVPGLHANVRDGFPSRVKLEASLGARGVGVDGPTPLRLTGVDIPELVLEASDLRPAPHSPYAVAGKARLRESLGLDEARFPGGPEASSLRHSLDAEGALDPDGTVSLRVSDLALGAEEVRVALPEQGLVRAPARARASVESLVVRGPGSPRVDANGVALEARLGDALQARVGGDVRDLGAEDLAVSGGAQLDLGRLRKLVPEGVWPGTAAGRVRVQWELAGRRPAPEELRAAAADLPGLAAGSPLPFMRTASVSVALDAVGAEGPVGDQRISLGGLATDRDVTIAIEEGARALTLDGALSAGWVEAVPGLGDLEPPLRATLAFQARRTPEGTVLLTQSSTVEPWSVRQDLELTLTGLDRVLRRGLDAPRGAWLGLLGGEMRGALGVGEAPDLGRLSGEVSLQGPLEADLWLRLARGQVLTGGLSLTARDAGARLGDRLSAEGLTADVSVERRFTILEKGRAAAGFASGPDHLSESVLGASAEEPAGRAASAVQLPRYGGTSTLGLAHLRLDAEPLPVHLDGFQAEVSFPRGLPSVDRFEVGVLGGALVGSLEITRPEDAPRFSLGGRVTFTGLDAETWNTGAAAAARSGEDTQVSGRCAFLLPLGTELPEILGGAEVDAELTRIGRRTLDRALYALDPTGSNEAIVKQRDLLRYGGPRWVRAEIRNGNLSVSGEVEAAGVRLQLPRLDRLNVAAVPGLDSVGSGLEALGPVLGALEAARADTLEIDEAGTVRFRKGGEP